MRGTSNRYIVLFYFLIVYHSSGQNYSMFLGACPYFSIHPSGSVQDPRTKERDIWGIQDPLEQGGNQRRESSSVSSVLENSGRNIPGLTTVLLALVAQGKL